MLRRFLFRPRTPAVRHSFQPRLEGLEARWVPATFNYNPAKQQLTVNVVLGDTLVNFNQDNDNPVGHISVNATTGPDFNQTTPTVFVKDIVVKVAADATTSIQFLDLATSGWIKVTSAATAGATVNLLNVDIAKGLTFTSSAIDAAANDSLTVFASSIGGSLAASLNQGNNAVSLEDSSIGTNLSIASKSGTDNVTLESVHVTGNATIKLGDNQNALTVHNGISTVDGSLVYTGGSGFDLIEVTNTADLHVDTNAIFNLGSGSGSVAITPQNLVTVGRNLTINGGVDNDAFEIDRFDVGRNATFNLGNSTGGQTFDTEGGSDVGGNLVINGGNNIDQLFILDLLVHGTSTIKLLGDNDVLRIHDSAFLGAALFDGGVDDDDFFIENDINFTGFTSFGGKLTILGGAGDDDLTLGDSSSPSDTATTLVIDGARTFWNGGPGASNNLTNDLVLNTNFFQNDSAPNIINWP